MNTALKSPTTNFPHAKRSLLDFDYPDVSVYEVGRCLTEEDKGSLAAIQQTIDEIRIPAHLKLRVNRNGPTFEALVWGSIGQKSIGFFKRSTSKNKVWQSISRRLRREAQKFIDRNRQRRRRFRRESQPLAA